jgi:hypothetical protein
MSIETIHGTASGRKRTAMHGSRHLQTLRDGADQSKDKIADLQNINTHEMISDAAHLVAAGYI